MKILIVDDDPMTRKMLTFLLRGEGFEVVIAESLRAARSILSQDTPWLILLDANLPDGSGFDFCRDLNNSEDSIPVIMLTARQTHEDKLLGFQYGADDYVVKPYDHSELVARIKAVLRRASHGSTHLVQDHLHTGDLELFMSELKLKKVGSKAVLLTPTEMKIMACLMVNVGKVLDRYTIAENALGIDYGSSSNVVDVYVRRLRKKIEIDPTNPKYIETVVGSGYRLSKQ